MEKVLFVTNKLFADYSKAEGGVRLCTEAYIKLISTRYKVIVFTIEYNTSFLYRVKAKLGLDVFEDYRSADYQSQLLSAIEQHGIKKVFINLSSATDVARTLKLTLGPSVTTVLCSHGIEAGDYLHQSVRFKHLMPLIKRWTAPFKIGLTMQQEVVYRTAYLDLILTVSQIELAIEKWLGGEKVYWVPRVFEPDFIPWKPQTGRLGFVADMSHFPNYHGVDMLCKAIVAEGLADQLVIRLVGKPCLNIDRLCKQYAFIQPLGFMDNATLKAEAGTWMYYLNLVFYYSKGVSTKLEKGMNWGLPVISTTAGNRGYCFGDGKVITCNDPAEMVNIIAQRILHPSKVQEDKAAVELAVTSFSSYAAVMEPVYNMIENKTTA